MNKIPASLRSDFSDCRFAPECVPVCFGIGGDFSGIRTRRTILVVEDEKLMLRLLERTLSQHSYAVFTAADGEAALETYCRHKTEIDLVLLDVGIPKVKGVDVLHKMKSENPGVQVVIFSGYLEPALRAKMREAGVEHFTQKPYMLHEVVKTIQSLIETA
jgi:DNA-binding response OmpR family regulator